MNDTDVVPQEEAVGHIAARWNLTEEMAKRRWEREALAEQEHPSPTTQGRYEAPRVPDDLAERDQWVGWAYIDGQKVPLQTSGRTASSTDPSTWASFERVTRYAGRAGRAVDGIGFVITAADPFVGLDLDDCLNDDGTLKEWAQPIIERFADCYQEISPSGRGIKIWCKGKLERAAKFAYGDGGVEVYDRARYFTVTGRVWRDAPLAIEEHQSDIDWLLSQGGRNGDSRRAAPIGDVVRDRTKHHTIVSLAGTIRHRGLPIEAAFAACRALNFESPVTDEDIWARVRSVYHLYEPGDETTPAENGAGAPPDDEEPERIQSLGTKTRPILTGAPEPVVRESEVIPALPRITVAGLVKRYVDMLDMVTEAPVAFHVAVFLAVVGLLIGRSAWVEYAHSTFPNLFVLLLGQTADARKTTAWRLGLQFLEEVSTLVADKGQVKPLFGLASVEGLAEAMRNVSDQQESAFRVLVIEDEFRSLIRKSNQKAVSNLIPRLTELYNTLPTLEVNTRKDKIAIPAPFVSIVSASTIGWFTESLAASEISGGFINRWSIFRAHSDRLIAFPESVDKSRWSGLCRDVASVVSRAEGGYPLAPDAREAFEKFYLAFRGRGGTDLSLEATARADLHAIKFGLVYAILAGHRRIEVDDIARGIALANYCSQITWALTPEVASGPAGAIEKKVVEYLRAHGRTASRDCYRGLNISAEDLQRALRALIPSGVVETETVETISGKPRVWLSLSV